MKPRALIVDDEKNIQRTLAMILRAEGYQVREAGRGEDALALLDESPADLVLLDVNLPGMNGIEALKQIKARHPEASVIMISGQATVSAAVEATRAGAFDFLEKPLSKERVLIAARNALAVESLSARVVRFESEEARRRTMVGSSASLERVRRHVEKAGPTAATVLITGESGTGKELVARALHEASPRRAGPFVKVNCAAIPEELIESELFGYVRGAFTGADRNRDGKFRSRRRRHDLSRRDRRHEREGAGQGAAGAAGGGDRAGGRTRRYSAWTCACSPRPIRTSPSR